MAKTCNYKECSNLQFGGGFCRIHQWCRTDGKRPKPIAKRATRKAIKQPDFGFDTQLQVFKHVFFHLRKPVICPISGRDITDIMDGPITQWICAFAHILPKKNYTHWRLNPRNIRMILPEAHNIIDQGTKADRMNHPDWNWGWWDAEVYKAKKEYVTFCKNHGL